MYSAKANLNGIRAQAELYYDTNGSYNPSGETKLGSCDNFVNSMFNDPNVIAAIEAAEEAIGEAATCSTEGLQKYAISIPLISEPSVHYCIDNAGNAGGITKEITKTSCSDL